LLTTTDRDPGATAVSLPAQLSATRAHAASLSATSPSRIDPAPRLFLDDHPKAPPTMASAPSTPVGITNTAEKTKPAAKVAATTNKTAKTTTIPFIPYVLPSAWAGIDQVVAAVLGCQTMGQFSDLCRGKMAKEPKAYWAVYWTFQELLITKNAPKISAQGIPNAVAQFHGNQQHWQLITEEPSVPITPDQMRDPNNPQYQNKGELEKALFHINTIKLLHYMLQQLDDHLNGRGTTPNHYGGHDLKDWMLMFMIFNRTQTETRKRRSGGKTFTSEDFYNISPHHKNEPPTFQLVMPDDVEGPTATAATEGEQHASESEDDIERPIVDVDQLFSEQYGYAFTKENIVAQMIMMQRFIARGEMAQAELSIDSKNRVKNVRPSVTPKSVDKLLGRCMGHVEVVSEGLHEKMTDAPQVSDSTACLDDHPNRQAGGL
jgi:hypothetical protein